HSAKVDDRWYFSIDVEPSKAAPHYIDKQWYERVGSEVRLGSPKTLLAYAASADASPGEPLALQRLAAQVNELATTVRSGHRWLPKLRDMLIGGIIGAAVSVLLAYLFGS
ncbi:MAG TPA: hypothetical protein VNQ74_03365, partial [Burkholderiaceae bacterium]|nr:hypothetical protein [Burkholderiaceae bacterium]